MNHNRSGKENNLPQRRSNRGKEYDLIELIKRRYPDYETPQTLKEITNKKSLQ